MGHTAAKQTKRRVATVGTFDGLHRGHRRVISTVKSEALARGLEPLVISFDRHPLETIAPERAPRLIQSPSERTNTLFNEGMAFLTLEFTSLLASMTVEQWLRDIHDNHGVDVLVVGYDNTFGCDGTGMNIADYRRLAAPIGIEIVEAPYEPKAASSAIRKLLAEGNIAEANHLLGRQFAITGEVVTGKKIGASIGFPTANISPSYKAQLPKEGVYAVDVVMPDGTISRGVANIGRQPTVADNAPLRLEAHIPGFSGNLYGERLTLKFLAHLRDERKFDSVGSLKKQIAEDIDTAKSII